MSNRLTFSLASLIVLIALLAAPAFVHAATAAFTSTGPYVEGSEIEVTLTLTPPAEVDVTLDATESNWPYIQIAVGANNRQAFYKHADVTTDTEISGLKKLVFVYTVGTETDTDGVSIAADQVSAGGGNSAIYDGGTTTPATTAIQHALVAGVSTQVVDTTAPTVQSGPTITTVSPYGLGDYITIEVDFNEPMAAAVGLPLKIGEKTTNLVYASQKSSGTTAATTDDVLVFTYQVAAGDNGQAEITATAVYPTSLQDKAGNSIAADTVINSAGIPIGPVSSSVPTVDSVNITSTGPYKAATDTITVAVVFSETVVLTGTPQIALTIGDETEQVDYSSGAPGTTLVFEHTIETSGADIDNGPVSIAANAISLNGGTIKNGAGTAANLDHLAETPPSSASQVVDSSPPVLTLTPPMVTTTNPSGLTSDGKMLFLIDSDEALAASDTLAHTDFMVVNAAALVAADLVKESTARTGQAESWTLTVTPTNIKMAVTVTLAANSVSDAVGHTAPASADAKSFTAPDITPPTVTVDAPESLNSMDKAVFEITFSEELSTTTLGAFTIDDLTVTHGSDPVMLVAADLTGPNPTGTSPTGDDQIYVLVVTPLDADSDGTPDDGTITIEVGNAILDLAGNQIDLSDSANIPAGSFVIDMTGPTVLSASSLRITPPSPAIVAFRFTFSEPIDVSTFTVSSIDQGASHNIKSLAPAAFNPMLVTGSDPLMPMYEIRVEIKDTADDTTVVLKVGTDAVEDMHGNGLEVSYSHTHSPPNTPPEFEDPAPTGLVWCEGVDIGTVTLPKAKDTEGDSLTYSLSPALDHVPTVSKPAYGLYWETIDSETRQLKGTVKLADAGTYTWTVTDEHGATNVTPMTFTITVNPYEEPEAVTAVMASKLNAIATVGDDVDKVKLTWTDPNPTAYPNEDCIPLITEYIISIQELNSHSLGRTPKGAPVAVVVDAADGTEYTTDTLAHGTYEFTVAARNHVDRPDGTSFTGESDASDEAVWNDEDEITGQEKTGYHWVIVDSPPVESTNLRANQTDDPAHSVTLDWIPPTHDPDAPVNDGEEGLAEDLYGVDLTYGGYQVEVTDQSDGEIEIYPSDTELIPGDKRTYHLSGLEPGEYTCRIVAVNIVGRGALSESQAFEIDVYKPPATSKAPDFGDGTVANIVATVGEAIDGRFLPEATDADSDAADLTYSIDPDVSEIGLDFNSDTRVLSGTPTEEQAETAYTYMVTDEDDNSDKIEFFITVHSAVGIPSKAPDFGDGTVANIVATVGEAINGRFLPEATDADSDAADLTYSIDPDVSEIGLKFDPSTRALTGTPTVDIPETAYTYMVTDEDDNSDKIGFFVTVKAAVQTPTGPHLTADYMNGVTTLSGTLNSNGFATVGADDLPNIQRFFAEGGSISVLSSQTGAVSKDVVVSEIMWGLDLNQGASNQDNQQFIELYNTTNAAINLSMVTIEFDSAKAVPTVPSGKTLLDQVSNVSGAGWLITDAPGSSGRIPTATNTGSANLVSMYRNIDYNKVEKTDHDADAKKNRDAQLKDFPNGNALGSWKASNVVDTYGLNLIGSPRTKHFVAYTPLTASAVDRTLVIINEIGNHSNDEYDWVELRNVSSGEINLKKWELSQVTSDKKDSQLVSFPDNDNHKIPAGGILLLVNSDPYRDTSHPIAAGSRINGGAEKTGSTARYYVDGGLKLANSGDTLLILRNANDKEGKAEAFKDVVGTLSIKDDSSGFRTSMWPLAATGAAHGNVIDNDKDNKEDDFRSGRAYKRLDAAGGTGEKDWSIHGYTGVGYKRSAANNGQNGGTPGYANDAVKVNVSDLSNASVTISEIMFVKGRNLPQWIELYNSSMTQAVNLSEWKLRIDNLRSDDEIDIRSPSVTTNNLGNVTIHPNQTVLIVSGKTRRDSRSAQAGVDFPDTRVVDLWGQKDRIEVDTGENNLSYQLLSETAFSLTLLDKGGAMVDTVGNLGTDRETVLWDLPMAEDEDGRSSIIRRYPSTNTPNVETDGMMAAAWVLASETNLAEVRFNDTYYGNATDIGTPGYRGGGPLPVSLSKFRPERLDDGSIRIVWVTESELNNAGFNILRSEKRDGEFKQINTKLIAGQGTTSERTTYTHTDTSAKPNVVYYYQIQDVSLDGKVQTLRLSRLKGNVSAAGKATTTWGELKALQ